MVTSEKNNNRGTPNNSVVENFSENLMNMLVYNIKFVLDIC